MPTYTRQVQEKARAAHRWCGKATSVGLKPWKYLLIPRDWIQENKTFSPLWDDHRNLQTLLRPNHHGMNNATPASANPDEVAHVPMQ
jgi:hypothetical protein